eukprot:3079039-Alexandrium_andersonii.AAC.1
MGGGALRVIEIKRAIRGSALRAPAPWKDNPQRCRMRAHGMCGHAGCLTARVCQAKFGAHVRGRNVKTALQDPALSTISKCLGTPEPSATQHTKREHPTA